MEENRKTDSVEPRSSEKALKRTGRPRGLPKTGGRSKGTPNRLTGELKNMILEAAHLAGGEGGATAYLSEQARANPVAFINLLGKLLPLSTELAAVAQASITIITGVPRHESDSEDAY
jgi:hypothetical protein